MACLQSGCDVFVEKPLSDRLDGVDALIQAADRAQRIAMVGYHMRFNPCLRALASVLESRVLGELLSVRATVGEYLPGFHPYEDYRQGKGEDLYRRSLYTFWKRSVPPPTMANFDASSRESCVVRQNATNTPLQALDVMNNVQYVEAARVLAQRMMSDGGATPSARLAYAFRRATARMPTAAQSAILLNAFNTQLASYKARPEAAAKYVALGESARDARLDVPELAAYTTVASLILNQSQTVVKD